MSGKDFVFDPAKSAAVGVQKVKEIQENRHRLVPLLIPSIGEYFAPVYGGTITAVQAQTHNGKSMFLRRWEDALAKYLLDNNRQEVIVHIDTEMSIQALSMAGISKFGRIDPKALAWGEINDWQAVFDGAKKFGQIPIYRIARDLGVRNQPDLTLSNMGRALNVLTKGKVLGEELKIAAIFIDYIQAIPFDEEFPSKHKYDRRLQVRDDIFRLRDMSAAYDCPVIVGVQAKQALTGHLGSNMLIPGQYDGEESAAIGQRADRIISLWMPKTTHTIGKELSHRGYYYTVNEEMMWVRVVKQREYGLPSGRSWHCEWDYENYSISVV